MLLATGITLIFGVMKVVNFAHGELMMLGAFVTFILAHSADLSPYLAIFVSMAAVGLVGVVIERFGFRWLRGGEKINEVFFSIALILILQNALARVFVPRFREHVQIKTPYATEVVDLGLITLRYDCIESAATFFLGGSWRDATAFVLLILVLLPRPQGLFREGT